MPSPIAQRGHPKMGGIKKGQKHKRTLAREAAEKIAEEKGVYITPLEIMQQLSNDTRLTKKLRLQAAASAAPYVHRKMPQTLELVDLSQLTTEELKRIAERYIAQLQAEVGTSATDES